MEAANKVLYGTAIIAGISTIIGAIIEITPFLLNSDTEKAKTEQVQSVPSTSSDVTAKKNILPDKHDNTRHPREVSYLIRDMDTEDDVSDVEYTIGSLRGHSNANGIIKFDFNELNPATEDDQFLMILQKKEYRTANVYIGLSGPDVIMIKKK